MGGGKAGEVYAELMGLSVSVKEISRNNGF
jgi:hypothetical protein